jgi:predicted RNase H-like HicB family nuclease
MLARFMLMARVLPQPHQVVKEASDLPLVNSAGLCERRIMRLTAVFEPAPEGGYSCFVEEIPAAISQGETLDEARANLLDALRLVVEAQRELAEQAVSPEAVRESLDLTEG